LTLSGTGLLFEFFSITNRRPTVSSKYYAASIGAQAKDLLEGETMKPVK
jgi:hypothetical protein